MTTTVKSLSDGRIKWELSDGPHEYFSAEEGWEALKATIEAAFAIFAEHYALMDKPWEDVLELNGVQRKALQDRREQAERNVSKALRAVDADVYALARAMSREGWGTYQRAIERVESYYRECYRERFGVKEA